MLEPTVYKIKLIGDHGVGKSSLILRFADNAFTSSYISTLGVAFKARCIQVDNTEVKLQVFDTMWGRERYRNNYENVRGAHVVFILFDLTNRESFNNLNKHVQDVERHALDGTPTIIIGTKSDLPGNKIDSSEAQDYCNQLNFPYFETSAKEGINVDEVFIFAARIILDPKIYANYEMEGQALSQDMTLNQQQYFCKLNDLWSQKDSDSELDKVKAVLDDYTCNNSVVGRLFSGRWASYAGLVNSLSESINLGVIKETQAVITLLEDKTSGRNTEGDIETIIRFLKFKLVPMPMALQGGSSPGNYK